MRKILENFLKHHKGSDDQLIKYFNEIHPDISFDTETTHLFFDLIKQVKPMNNAKNLFKHYSENI